MRLLDCIKICSTCKHQSFEAEGCVICSLTQKRPAFEDQCPLYSANKNIEDEEVVRHTPIEESPINTNSEQWIIGFAKFILFIGCIGSLIYATYILLDTENIKAALLICLVGILGSVYCWAILSIFANISLRLQKIDDKLDRLKK